MAETAYHIGLIKGTGRTRCWANGHRASTVIVQMRRDVDYLSEELWQYMGRRITTKARIKAQKAQLLAAINKQFGTTFARIIID